MRYLWLSLLLITSSGWAQPSQKIAAAWTRMLQNEQLSFASAGICVMDLRTGEILFADNHRTGLAPASTTKVLTSIAAFDALGAAYQYKTNIYIQGKINAGILDGDLIIDGTGDPSLGSWRYASTKNNRQLQQIAAALTSAGIRQINGNLVVRNTGFDNNPVPPYWPWADIGNYYGAGIWPLNWNENQYDLYFKTGSRPGQPTSIAGQKPADLPITTFWNQANTGPAGFGDQSVIYTAPYSKMAFIQGSLQANETRFAVSGAVPDGERFMLMNLQSHLKSQGISCLGKIVTASDLNISGSNPPEITDNQLFTTITSPTLDTLVYWFMKKSINLYGEAFARTIGKEKGKTGSTEAGLEWMEKHFKAAGIDPRGMHLTDGSGLSPTNRIAPLTLCEALRYAKTRPWFAAYLAAFPEYNGMTLKSGTIHRVKCFAGYQGNYAVAIMVNNYNGSSSGLVSQLYAVLNTLK